MAGVFPEAVWRVNVLLVVIAADGEVKAIAEGEGTENEKRRE